MTMTLTFSTMKARFGKHVALGAGAALFAALFAVSAAAGEAATGAPARLAQDSATVGTFTGRYANGVAVYRLPPVTVVASRKAELAKWEHEQQRVRYGRADYPARREN